VLRNLGEQRAHIVVQVGGQALAQGGIAGGLALLLAAAVAPE
jgi:hypothetical protein